MAAFFTRERFGRPQVYAGLLLLLFMAQCLWVIASTPFREGEVHEISRGLSQWHGEIDDAPQSPLIALLASAGIAALPGNEPISSSIVQMLPARLPFLFLALLRASSLWYVTRRLYGNAGGYVALTLYCFSPSIVASGALINTAGPSAWGFFGGIFSGIALSHTVYALGDSPTQQLLGYRQWRWRRIVLLGVAFGIAVGGEYFAILVIPLALGFMLYLAPGRRTACLAIVAVATAIGGLVLLSVYFFHLPALLSALRAGVLQSLKVHYSPLDYPSLLSSGPILPVLFVVSLVVYLAWSRTRYFGNSAPLLVFTLLAVVALFVSIPQVFEQHAIIFAFVFVSGIMADLLETRRRRWILAGLIVLLVLHAALGMSMIRIYA